MKSLRTCMMRQFAVAIAVYQAAASTALADVVVLRDGTELHGKLANREQVRLAANAVAQLVWLPESAPSQASPEVILIGIVQSVRLEDGDKTQTVDFSDRPAPPPGAITRAPAAERPPDELAPTPQPLMAANQFGWRGKF